MTKNELLNIGRQTATVDLGSAVAHVRTLSTIDIEQAEKRIKQGESPLVVWVSLSACDEQGNRLFTDDDCASLGSIPARAAKAICDAAVELNGLAS